MSLSNVYSFESPSTLFIGFAVLFFFYYNIFIDFNRQSLFFFMAVFVILFVLFLQNKNKADNISKDVSTFVAEVEAKLPHDAELPQERVFNLHKIPRNVKMIKSVPECKTFLFNLKFLRLYDEPLYQKIVSYLEYFLKVHYKIMLGKYDFKLYYPILKDVRIELLNTMKTIYFNIPRQSTVMDIPDLDVQTDEQIKVIQTFTHRYMKILDHKFDRVEAPLEYDSHMDNHYHTF